MNVWNNSAVTKYFYDAAEGNALLGRYLDMALHRAILKEDTLVETRSLPENAPDWMRRKWPDGGPYYEFIPSNNFDNEVQTIAEWIKVAMINNEPWLHEVDSSGKPLKLNIGRLDEALAKADKAMGRRTNSLAPLLKEGADVTTVLDFGDGFSIVYLMSPKALDYETSELGHCIGRGAYDTKLHNAGYAYFSLRQNGRPVATLEVDSEILTACQGKRHEPPPTKCIPYIREFLEHEGFGLGDRSALTGLIVISGKIYNVYDLPQSLRVDGDLDLRGTTITRLPSQLSVSGNLYLPNTVRSIPDDLNIGGEITIRDTPNRWANYVAQQRPDPTVGPNCR